MDKKAETVATCLQAKEDSSQPRREMPRPTPNPHPRQNHPGLHVSSAKADKADICPDIVRRHKIGACHVSHISDTQTWPQLISSTPRPAGHEVIIPTLHMRKLRLASRLTNLPSSEPWRSGSELLFSPRHMGQWAKAQNKTNISSFQPTFIQGSISERSLFGLNSLKMLIITSFVTLSPACSVWQKGTGTRCNQGPLLP